MNFVESLEIFHVAAKEIPCLTGKGAPTVQTEGAPGVLYMDTDTGGLYKCRGGAKNGYLWELQSGGFTEADKAEIVGAVLDALSGEMVPGYVDSANNIIINNLPDGSYTVKYEMADGSTIDIGALEVGSSGPAYTNLADPSSADWLAGHRLGTSSASASEGGLVTNYIPCKKGDVVRVKGLRIGILDISGGNSRCWQCASDKTIIDRGYVGTNGAFVSATGLLDSPEWTYIVGTTGDSSTYMENADNIAYIRFSGYLGDMPASEVVITVNEEIV